MTVNLSLSGPQNTVGAGTDTLTNIRNLEGSQFNDTLIGDANANVLNGSGTQGNGGDVYTGDAGNDTFIFSWRATVTDFNRSGDLDPENDKIDLSFSNAGNGLTTAELQDLIDASAGDTIDFGDGQTLMLTGLTINTQLTVNDFILPP